MRTKQYHLRLDFPISCFSSLDLSYIRGSELKDSLHIVSSLIYYLESVVAFSELHPHEGSELLV